MRISLLNQKMVFGLPIDGINLSKATFSQGGKQVKEKSKRFSSSVSNKKNFKGSLYHKGIPFDNSPETKHTTSLMDLTDQTVGPLVVNEPASKVFSPVPIDLELFIDLVTNLVDTQMTKVSQFMDILSNNHMKEEVSLIEIFKKMVTNLGTEVDKLRMLRITKAYQPSK
ncbi:hypothetical protein ACH5RR_012854 [Cinchona calisaya]|uniref:Uncharacterized protein n=1 Tax=Cinchona calisaya TaxID=153742 RepID=A0ABD3AER3_9GENT